MKQEQELRNLRDKYLRDLPLRGARFNSLEVTDISNSDLSESNFMACNIRDTRFTNVVAQRANFFTAKAKRWQCIVVNFEGSRMSNMNAPRCVFHSCDFRKCDMSGAMLNHTSLTQSNFSRTTLYCSRLMGADAHKANFSNADLRACDFTAANLRGSTLYGARIENALFRGAFLPKGCMQVSIPDGREYSFTYFPPGILREEGIFHAGCRVFTENEARAHWGNHEYPNRERGDMYLRAVEYILGK